MNNRELYIPDTRASKTRVFCGAFTIMALTGRSHEQVKDRLREVNDWSTSKRIMGMWTWEVTNALRSYGIANTQKKYAKKDRPTLAKWLRDRRGEQVHNCYLITLTHHYVLVNGNQFIDTFTQEPVHVDDCPHRCARIKFVNLLR